MKNSYLILMIFFLASIRLTGQVSMGHGALPVACTGDTIEIALIAYEAQDGVIDILVYVKGAHGKIRFIGIRSMLPGQLELEGNYFVTNPDFFAIRKIPSDSLSEAATYSIAAGDTLAMLKAVVLMEGEDEVTITEGCGFFRSNLLWYDESGVFPKSFIDIPPLTIRSSASITAELLPIDTLTCANDVVTVALAGNYHDGTSFSLFRGVEFMGEGNSQELAIPGDYTMQIDRNVCSTALAFTVQIDSVLARPQVRKELKCGELTGSLEVLMPVIGYTHEWIQQGEVMATGPVFEATPGNYQLRTTNLRNGCVDVQDIALEPAGVSTELMEVTLPATLRRTCQDSIFSIFVDLDETLYIHELYFEGELVGGTSLSGIDVSEIGTYELHIAQLNNQCTRVFALEIIQDDFVPEVLLETSNVTCVAPASLEVVFSEDYTVEWRNAASVLSNAPQYSTMEPGAYLVDVRDARTGCVYSAGVEVFDDRMSPDFVVIPPVLPECGANTLSLSVVTDEGNDVSVAHSTLGSLSSEDGAYTMETGGWLFVEVTSSEGCRAMDSVFVEDFQAPLRFESTYLEVPDCGTAVLETLLHVGRAGGGTAPLRYQLGGEEVAAAEVYALNIGNHQLVVTDANGCSIDTLLEVVDEPVVASIIGVEDVYRAGDWIELVATEVPRLPESSYVWTFGDSVLTGRTLMINAEATINLKLEVIGSGGCRALDVVTLVVDTQPDIYFPNAFNPHSEQAVNRRFGPMSGDELRGRGRLMVYDRWGQLVFEGEGLIGEIGWDGTMNGELVSVDTYVYIFYYVDEWGEKHKFGGGITRT
jgi:hypothetical protein